MNGYFELSDNRRDIWWGDDMLGLGKVKADWNLALLQDIIVPAYKFLLMEMGKKIQSGGKALNATMQLKT